MSDAAVCRWCKEPVEAGRRHHSECLSRYRRSVDYRANTLERDGYACAMCPGWWNWLLLSDRWTGRLRFAPWTTRKVDVDHIDPLGLTGTSDPMNMQIACRPHHKRKTRRDLAKMRGRRVPLGWLTKARWAVYALVAWVLWQVGAERLLGIGEYDLLVDPVGALGTAAPRIGAVLVAWFAVRVWRDRRRALLKDLHLRVATITKASETARRPIRVHRWGRVGWRWVPVDVSVVVPRTFHAWKASLRQDVEAAVVTRLGWTQRWSSYAAAWDPVRGRVRLRAPDPFMAAPAKPWPSAVEVAGRLADGVLVAYDRSMLPVVLDLFERNLLIGGEPGAGKSNAFAMLMAKAALDPTIEIHMIDLKKVEQKVWRRCATEYATDRAEAVRLLKNLQAIMVNRYDVMALNGQTKITKEDPEFGIILLAIDELEALTAQGSKQQRDEMCDLIRDIINQGRGAGIISVLATQRPSHDVVPTNIRDKVGLKWAMRCPTPAASDMILGDGWARDDEYAANAARIPGDIRGMGWLLPEDGRPRLVRAYYMPDDVRAALAARAEAIRGVVPAQREGADEDVVEREGAA